MIAPTPADGCGPTQAFCFLGGWLLELSTYAPERDLGAYVARVRYLASGRPNKIPELQDRKGILLSVPAQLMPLGPDYLQTAGARSFIEGWDFLKPNKTQGTPPSHTSERSVAKVQRRAHIIPPHGREPAPHRPAPP